MLNLIGESALHTGFHENGEDKLNGSGSYEIIEIAPCAELKKENDVGKNFHLIFN